LRRELDLHLEQLTKEHMLTGLCESEARLAALREFGSLTLIKEHCRDMRRVHFIDDLLQDLAFAFRLLAKSPGFTLTAVLSLALAIGANTAIFSLVDAVLMRMLPVRDPQQLVELTRPGGGTLSYPMYLATRDRSQVFSGVLSLASGRSGAGLQLGEIDLGDVHLSPVSGDYFAVLGVSPVIGRALTEEDLAPSNAAVISYGLWQRSFASDPSALGKALRVGGHPFTIVGVAPAGFTGVVTGQPVDLWVPMTSWMDRGSLQNPGALMFRVMARRKPGVSEKQTRANVEVLARQWSKEWKFQQPMPIEVRSASGGLTELRRRFSRRSWS